MNQALPMKLKDNYPELSQRYSIWFKHYMKLQNICLIIIVN